ncbi:hypothetical protein SUGI_0272430 [Cryptomeria japonica]|uniref:uncharacterized protein LOC131067457 n=1 Tax=Cryptomeria japonica TaxID=3369 RepID=UPI002408A4C3|nr:uncharacterized protein LOC131067457 [Cryptomeria japonica]GLJ16234.1 hypothetical protein SUGI_0272430 [Cryptomeria japonica]
MHHQILTGERLQKLGYVGPHWCSLCKNNEETINHLFVECTVAKRCWEHFCGMTRWSNPLPNTIREVFSFWPHLNKGSLWHGLWYTIPAMVVWQLWKERNARVLTDKDDSMEAILAKIEVGVSEHQNEIIKQCNYVSTWDEWITKTWRHLILPKNDFLRTKVDISKAKWIMPPPSKLKLNFDGASQSLPNRSGYGFIIRNHRGAAM